MLTSGPSQSRYLFLNGSLHLTNGCKRSCSKDSNWVEAERSTKGRPFYTPGQMTWTEPEPAQPLTWSYQNRFVDEQISEKKKPETIPACIEPKPALALVMRKSLVWCQSSDQSWITELLAGAGVIQQVMVDTEIRIRTSTAIASVWIMTIPRSTS